MRVLSISLTFMITLMGLGIQYTNSYQESLKRSTTPLFAEKSCKGRLPASKERPEEETTCEHENTKALLEKELAELKKEKERFEKLLDEALADTTPTVQAPSLPEDFNGVYLPPLSHFLPPQNLMPPPMIYLDNGTSNYDQNRMMNYMNLAMGNNMVLKNEFYDSWFPQFDQRGSLQNPLQSPWGPQTFNMIEQMYTPVHTLQPMGLEAHGFNF